MRIDDKSAGLHALSVPAGTSAAQGSGLLSTGSPGSAANPAFGEALVQARQAPGPATRAVVAGDTLVGVVREQAQQRGVTLTPGQTFRQAQQLARDSSIANPNRIFPGQALSLGGLHAQLDARSSQATGLAVAPSTAAVIAAFQPVDPQRGGGALTPALGQAQPDRLGGTPGLRQSERVGLASTTGLRQAQPERMGAQPERMSVQPERMGAQPERLGAAEPADAPATAANKGAPHPVLEQTLDRAVSKGFIPAIERGDVYDKILQLASNHRFKPDDFARMTLMESDGMNPQATNQRCHGIIQFCDGADRGAATAGFAANPRAILGFSVYQQLHLVDKYFTEVGVKAQAGAQGTTGLDDLYLSVLMPSARNNTQPNAPLNISGPQASYLHVGRDRSAPITRQSILEGLQQNAAERLAPFASPRSRLQALRLSGYEDAGLPSSAPVSPRVR